MGDDAPDPPTRGQGDVISLTLTARCGEGCWGVGVAISAENQLLAIEGCLRDDDGGEVGGYISLSRLPCLYVRVIQFNTKLSIHALR